MAENLTIKITGAKEVQMGLKRIEENLSRVDEPLDRSGRFMQLEAFANFPAEGGVFGESWPPLKEVSKIIKEKKGFGGQPLMVRTGKLFSSFQVNKGKNFVEIFNPVSYANLHQKGIGKLPRRVLLKFAKKQIDEITKIFKDWASQTIFKSFK